MGRGAPDVCITAGAGGDLGCLLKSATIQGSAIETVVAEGQKMDLDMVSGTFPLWLHASTTVTGPGLGTRIPLAKHRSSHGRPPIQEQEGLPVSLAHSFHSTMPSPRFIDAPSPPDDQ